MPTTPKIRISDYYELVPSKEHKTGDIWSGLPFHGAFGQRFGVGLVITPACDLLNRKVETITYVPIISIHKYMSSPAFLPEVYRELNRLLNSLNLKGFLEIKNDFIPINNFCELKGLLNKEKEKNNQQNLPVISRIISGLDHIRTMSNRAQAFNETSTNLRTLFGDKALGDIFTKIVQNSYKSDIHFLPCDKQPEEWSGVPCHSVALFRYPQSVSCPALDIAQNIDNTNWHDDVTNFAISVNAENLFGDERPLKRLCVKPRFVSDLVARFVGVHIRIGSPDFSRLTIQDYVNELINT